MDSNTNDCKESNFDEGAFWHTNMDLYYGFSPGEIVEVEHESGKYWLASIKYAYRNLILLDWVGKYGEFWVDTSSASASTNPCGISNGVQVPRRLYPPGHHLQSQLKSQYKLEKPTKFLEKPSLYNPAKDPYAEIKTVDDLLAHDPDKQINDDAFINKSTSETAELVLAKCKTKIDYKQEDLDELEAALQNLNDLDRDESKITVKSPTNENMLSDSDKQNGSENQEVAGNIEDPDNKDSGISSSDISNQPSSSSSEKDTIEISRDEAISPQKNLSKTECDTVNNNDELALKLCKEIQATAINKGCHQGLSTSGNELTDRYYPLKPKQFYDMGGANQERLFVPGTILEVSHKEGSWFAFVVKNVGGRLTLRWFLCDDPKFKQGRLELKTCRSIHVEEMKQPDNPDDDEEELNTEFFDLRTRRLRANGISFVVHFCDPKIQKLGHAQSVGKEYEFPGDIRGFLAMRLGSREYYQECKMKHIDHIFEARRIHLDKDRPLIDHILTVIDHRAPRYIDLVFAAKDKTSERQVLISGPKMTKLRKGTVITELERGVFVIEIEHMRGKKIIYPYDSAYTVLPLDWSNDHEDCLSADPKKGKKPLTDDSEDSDFGGAQGDKPKKKMIYGYSLPNSPDIEDASQNGHSQNGDSEAGQNCLIWFRKNLPKPGGPFDKVKLPNLPQEIESIPNFDSLDPNHWQELLHMKEQNVSKYHCCIDNTLKDRVESKFQMIEEIEVRHPATDRVMCKGRIRRVIFPLLWIQLATNHNILVAFNSTDIYPDGWAEANNHRLITFTHPKKRNDQVPPKRRKKVRS